MVNRLPTAKEIWSRYPKPALSTKVKTMSKSGMYVFRLTEGKDLQEQPYYHVETRSILGMIDDFCGKHTKSFSSLRKAQDFYAGSRLDAKAHYKKLKEKQERRIRNYDKAQKLDRLQD